MSKAEKGRLCSICGVSLEKKGRSTYRLIQSSLFCLKCYRKTNNRNQESNKSVDSNDQNDTVSTEASRTSQITLPFIKPSFSTDHCVLCNRSDRVLRRLTRQECIEAFVTSSKNLFLLYGLRICSVHTEDDVTSLSQKLECKSTAGVSLSGDEVASVFETMKKMILDERAETSERAVTSFLAMNPKMLAFETGLNHDQFQRLLECLKNENLHVRHVDFSLGIYLSRLRRGYTFEELAYRWDITRQTASKHCEEIRQALLKSFCEKYISFHLNRDELTMHQSYIAKGLHGSSGNTAIVVWDGTYIFIQKSSNFSFQRITYSGHKHRNLIKPMMAVLSDGYIAGVFGPYAGNKNDASILNELLDKNIWHSFQEGDVFLIDRGFRDSLPLIAEKGFIGKMPEFADKPSAPLTTAQGNRSRLVTKNRYIVEVINGRIKGKFKYFAQVIQNTTLNSLFQDFKIGCALLNLCFEPLKTSVQDRIIIDRMLCSLNKTNPLSELVEGENLNSRSTNFQRFETLDVASFPKLTILQLQLYTCGTYQIKTAISYYAYHVANSGDFEFQIAKENAKIDFRAYLIPISLKNSLLIKVKLRSRHSNATKYFVYVLIDKIKTGLDAIIGHTCGCKVGKRVVGCCSHVATILWYFGYARHQDKIPIPGQHLDGYFDEELSSEDEELN